MRRGAQSSLAARSKAVSVAAPSAHKRLWLYNKPRGALVSRVDAHGRRCLLPELAQRLGRQHVVSVGRLDMDRCSGVPARSTRLDTNAANQRRANAAKVCCC